MPIIMGRAKPVSMRAVPEEERSRVGKLLCLLHGHHTTTRNASDDR